MGDRADRERLPRTGTGHDSKPAAHHADGRGIRFLFPEFLRERRELGAVRAPESRLDVEPERELDRFAGRARWRDDDQAAGRSRTHERIVVGREIWIANAAEIGRVDYPGSTGGAWGRCLKSGAG